MERFCGRDNATASTSAPIIKAALLHLGEVWPEYLRFDDLVAAARSRLEGLTDPPSTISPADIKRLETNLIECCGGGIIDVHLKPHSFMTSASQRPAATALARWQAAHGEVATNRRHAPIQLDNFDRHVLQLLDGTRDHAGLLDQLVIWASQGRIAVMEGQQSVRSPQRAWQLLELALPQVLTRLAQNAFLVS